MKLNYIECGDCLELFKNIPDKSIDLIITSPPYNIGKYHHSGNNSFKAYKTYNDNLEEEEYQKWQIKVLNECYRVLKDDGSLMYNHKNRIKDGVQITPYEWILKTNFIVKQEIVWFNGGPNFDKVRFYPMSERVYWLSKTPQTKFYNNINHHDLFFKNEWEPQGTKKEFKRAFPVKMVKDLISCFKDSNIILDPFMGSGTTAVASKQLGKHYIGFEIDKDYCEIANSRLKSIEKDNRLISIKRNKLF